MHREPRGLPGTIIDRVTFQKAAEGYPLDDVVINARDSLGKPATLEVQVKRGITSAPGDKHLVDKHNKIFREVVRQVVVASLKPEFLKSRFELSIAISRTSHS